MLGRAGRVILVARELGRRRAKWVGAPGAEQAERPAVGAIGQPGEASREAPAEAARLDEEAREAQRFVEEVEPLLTEAERQMGETEEEQSSALLAAQSHQGPPQQDIPLAVLREAEAAPRPSKASAAFDGYKSVGFHHAGSTGGCVSGS